MANENINAHMPFMLVSSSISTDICKATTFSSSKHKIQCERLLIWKWTSMLKQFILQNVNEFRTKYTYALKIN